MDRISPEDMPDINEFLAQWFEERGVDLFCPACGRQQWQPSQFTSTPFVSPTGHDVGVIQTPVFYLLLPVYCLNCKYVVFFNAGGWFGYPNYFPEPGESVVTADDDAPPA